MPSQWFLLILVGIILFFYIRKILISQRLRHYSPAELAERLATDRHLVLLDVRSNGERRHSHIDGSLHIPLHQLANRSGELSKHRDKEIVCYCQSGNRSVTAAARLNKLGFNAANLKGGIAEWNFQNKI